MSPPAVTTLQSLIWPEQGICTERDLYVRLHGPAGFSAEEGMVHFSVDSRAEFNTWFNLFNIGKWQHNCALSDLQLSLEGAGRFEVSVFLALPERSWERLVNEVVSLSATAPTLIDLSHVFDLELTEGVLFFELRALSRGKLTAADWVTADAPRRVPELMLSITTFRREAAVQRTARRFGSYISTSPLKDHIRLTVVDNGQSVTIPESSNVTVVPNENLGGAGGFSRGLLAARDSGASHCLFMDDDASVHMASLDRTWRFLAYAIDPATAVAGAMINASHRWAIWENGAVFNTRCMPLYMGTDLRDPGQSFGMEYATTGPAPANFYGGWWYFAFPVDKVAHQPFPFFVRGDDVSFSLVHDFNIVTLNGVVSFQDSFTDKESPLTWYLDLRSHMAHHLSLPSMEIGALRTLKIAVWFFLRNLPRMHYETIAAINLALADVLRGPEFFDANADMAQRRADIKALTRQEAWVKSTGQDPSDSKWRMNPHNRWTRLVMKLTLNGHLLPLFSLFGNRIVLEAQDRGSIHLAWGASEITYLSANKRQCYTVRHSKRAFLRESARFTALALTFLRRYPRLVKQYRKGYDELTGEGYWRAKLGMAGDGVEGTAP
ncbi:hypothetical protein [Aquicoccus sp. SU-CL01552]|uniref:hypothetical protein n=1 Tax=Aquicoccus sp. SU-CL01552 TaxID=3127656 RepID=UPI0033402BC1